MEVLGVTALVYAGGWSWIMEANERGNILSVGLTHMLVMSVMVWTGAAISGSHFNPAVTLSLMITGKMKFFQGIFYIIAQVAGSLLGGITLIFLVPT
jgi:glycerol uptake facilitator-like aquaporin